MKLLTFVGPAVLLPLIWTGAGCSDSNNPRSPDGGGGSTAGGAGGTGAVSGGSAGSGGGGSGGASGTGGGGTGGASGTGGGGRGGTGPTTDSGGGRGGSGADAAVCQYGVDAPNPLCDPCAQQNCCDELGACLTNTACQGVNTCVNAQPSTPCPNATTPAQLRTCLQELCADAASGVDLFIDTQRCLATSCATECG